MNASLEIAKMIPSFPEIHRSSVPYQQLQFISQAFLSGFRVPLLKENVPVLSTLISQATVDRIPAKAIDAVSQARRMYHEKQKSGDQDPSLVHEEWLGDIARHIINAKKQQKSAYEDIFGVPYGQIRESVRKEIASMPVAIASVRRQDRQIVLASKDLEAIVERYIQFLTRRQDSFHDLTPQERLALKLPNTSSKLIESALFFEKTKSYIHDAIYSPFLKEETKSIDLATFLISNYKKAHPEESIQMQDLTRKTYALHTDLEAMTGIGMTMVGLVRGLGVIESGTQAEESKLVRKMFSTKPPYEIAELPSIAMSQQEMDFPVLQQILHDVGEAAQEIVRMVKRISSDNNFISLTAKGQKISDRTEYLLTTYIEPLFAGREVFTKDSEGNSVPVPLDSKLLFTLLPDVLKVRSGLQIAASSNAEQQEFMKFLQAAIMKGPQLKHLASRFTPEYFASSKQGERVIRAEEVLRRMFWEIPAFTNHIDRLQRTFGFSEAEIAAIVDMVIEEASFGFGLFDGYGLSLPGSRARTPSENHDSYLQDNRFYFAMVADGVGKEEDSGIASSIMRVACEEVLSNLWHEGAQYPLSESQAKTALIKMVGLAAEKIFQAMSEDLKEYLFGNPQRINPQTGKPFEPHLQEIGNFFATTFTGALPFVKDNTVYVAIASVGDSRAYLGNMHGMFVPLTRDHSFMWEYVGTHEKSASLIDGILSNISKEVPYTADQNEINIATIQAIHTEVEKLDAETKSDVIADVIDALEQTVVFSVEDIRLPKNETTSRLLDLQEFLGSKEDIGEDTEGRLHAKLTAIVELFYSYRNLVGKYIGIRTGYISPQDIATFPVAQGDRIVLMTDGVHDNIAHSRLEALHQENQSISSLVYRLHEEALQSLALERMQGKISSSAKNTVNIRAKPDDGITVVAQEMSRQSPRPYTIIPAEIYSQDALLLESV
jgi:serine/threonine protein phosphatase PrpC